jgi:hypothetical protein
MVDKTENHEYNVPQEGETDWHVPLNENFENYDSDIEVRDTESNRSNYTPKAGAKFTATDTGRVFVGDGSSWNHVTTTGPEPALDRVQPETGSLDVDGGLVASGSLTADSVSAAGNIFLDGYLGVGKFSSQITAPDDRMGVAGEVSGDDYVGMFVNAVGSSDARPYYSYAVDDSHEVWTYYDGKSDEWRVNNGGDQLRINSSGVGIGRSANVYDFEIGSSNGMQVLCDDTGIRVLHDGSSGEAIRADADDATAIWGVSQNGKAGLFSGNVNVTGTLEADKIKANTKNFVETVETEDGRKEVTYTSVESDTPHTETSGVARLEDGRAEVDLPEHFAWVTSDEEPLAVQTTPHSVDSGGLAAVERSTHRIVLADLEGEGDYGFSYTVKGTREGYEDQQVVDEPSESGPPGDPGDDGHRTGRSDHGG